MGLGLNIGIDLGTATVLIYVHGRGIVLREPSVVAVNTRTGRVLAVGERASLMLGRTPDIVKAVRPLRDGVISDFQVTEIMLKEFISRINTGFLVRYFKPTIVVSVPGVEKSYAVQAGREIRVMVLPDSVSDEEMPLLVHELCQTIERELHYPGQIKVNMIRESRYSDYAK
jgi:actin-like ATPase involved in cell morphogenesis